MKCATGQEFPYPFPKQALVFTSLQYNVIENNVGKGDIDRYEQFLFFPQYLQPVKRTFCHFHQSRNCRLQTLSVWKGLKFLVSRRLSSSKCIYLFSE